MAKGHDKNFVSIWFWLFTMLVLAIPLVNLIMIIVWAFVGENESRKNYFKAVIVVFCLVLAFTLFLIYLGTLPILLERLARRLK